MGASKTPRNEDFPVASLFLAPHVRQDVSDFYKIARAGDDVADASDLSADEKIRQLDDLRAGFRAVPGGIGPLSDLWAGFERDAQGWTPPDMAALVDQCRLTAAPVARYLLDRHGERSFAYPAGEALAIALQLLNHISDRSADEAAGRRRLPARISSAEVLGEALIWLEQARPLPRLLLTSRLRRQAAMTWTVARIHAARLAAGRKRPGLGAWLSGLWAGLRPLERMPLPRSSFALAIASLKGEQRRGLQALYGYCRALDDLADGEASGDLMPTVRALTALEFGVWQEPLSADLAWASARFNLSMADLRAVLDGVAMDEGAPIQAPDEATFALYCDRVAGAVGRLTLAILGTPHPRLASTLGRALQRVNILRDLAEDADRDRLYLPDSLLARHDIPPIPAEALAHPAMAAAAQEFADEAEQEMILADAWIAALPDPTARRPLRLMLAAYRLLLPEIMAQLPTPGVKLRRRDKLKLLMLAHTP
ncbi:squalene/phytoene synthase family protein [Lacibacterium aquatile]|uniref:Squalene/phytoene synthase family protein n=1 Tax=Lacibacterium aquatile TaxID=1168082 RepID=A0ABW5DVG5_9PROT